MGNETARSRALEEHIRFNDGALGEPIEEQGIVFWQVGRNASHSFYAGESNGVEYICSEYEDVNEDDEPLLVRRIREVNPESGWGYVGHY